MHYIENLTDSLSKQSEYIRIKEIELSDSDCALPLSYRGNEEDQTQSFKIIGIIWHTKKNETRMKKTRNKNKNTIKIMIQQPIQKITITMITNMV